MSKLCKPRERVTVDQRLRRMADVIEDPVAPIVENVVENITAATNGTAKPPSTPEGMALAYGSLVVMALIPIFFGSFRSVKHQQQQKVKGNSCSVKHVEA